MNFDMKLAPSGDCALTVTLGSEISEALNNYVHALHHKIEAATIDGILDLTPTYCALMITYSPLFITYDQLSHQVKALAQDLDPTITVLPRVIEIPTVYGGVYGPDLETVAKVNCLDVNEVIRIHSEQTYRIYMLGFTPGFPYLGGLDERIATPRLDKPRLKIPAGSVGIAGSQTGIYPLDSPGGWQIIGQTPLALFDPNRETPLLLRAGDSLKFVPISPETFEVTIKASADINENKTYNPNQSTYENTVEILKPGLLTLVEDFGRYGYGQYGVPVAGVMDTFATTVANILVFNPRTAAVLEMTLSGADMRMNFTGFIAITGADISPSINNVPVKMWETIRVNEGDILTFGSLKKGLRSYLAISGGVNVPAVMDSRSTYAKAGLGGFQGRALKQGDILKVGKSIVAIESKVQPFQLSPVRLKSLDEALIPNYKNHIKLRVILGPQHDRFTYKGIETFLSNAYQLTSECDRMGCRLEGAPIEHVTSADIISDGIAFGAVQVPGTGQPIIMMADRQTTGGYTKIATVISTDLWKLAQAKPGDTVIFTTVDIDAAQEIHKKIELFYLELENNWQTTNC